MFKKYKFSGYLVSVFSARYLFSVVRHLGIFYGWVQSVALSRLHKVALNSLSLPTTSLLCINWLLSG